MLPPRWNRLLRLCVTLVAVLCTATGCNDLPETNYPLLSAAQGEVTSQESGRVSDWKFEKGRFKLERVLEPNVFERFNEKQVRDLIDQAFDKQSLSTAAKNIPPQLGEDLHLAVSAFLHPSDTLASRVVTLTQESMPRTATSRTIAALNLDGSRLLLVEDKLTLWDTKQGQLLKEMPSPTASPKFVFLSTAGEHATLLDEHKAYRVSFDTADTSESKMMAKNIRQVAASEQRDVFLVKDNSEFIRLDADLKVTEVRQHALSDNALLSLSRDGQIAATCDGNRYSLFRVEDGQSLQNHSLVYPDLLRNVLATSDARMNVVFAHHAYEYGASSTRLGPNWSGIQQQRQNEFHTTLAISRAVRTSEKGTNERGWFALGAERLDDNQNPSQYLIYDVNIRERSASLPTLVGNRRPDLMEFSDDGRVLVTAYDDNPMQVYFRGPRVIQRAERDAIVKILAEMILDDQYAEAVQLINKLEGFARSLPYTIRFRQLLDLQSPVAKYLANHFNNQPSDEITPGHQALLDSDSTLSKLVQATQWADRPLNNGKAQAFVEEILSGERPPVLAFEIWTNLKSTMKLDPEILAKHFVSQFERDPLNPDLHLCMTSFYQAEKVGYLGQPDIYLAKVGSFLPADQRDAFNCLGHLIAIQAFGSHLEYSRQSGPRLLYDLNGPYAIAGFDLTGQWSMDVSTIRDSLGVDSERMTRGLKSLLQKDSAWELPQSLWPGLVPINQPNVWLRAIESVLEDYRRLYPFTFADEFTANISQGSMLLK